jgi:YHS domain-containing protein
MFSKINMHMIKLLRNLILIIAILAAGNSSFAQNVDPVDKNHIANGGYDLVSYFTDSAPIQGSEEFTHEINGVKYQFASAQHKEIFKADPQRYLPVCEGYCAWGVAAKGVKVPVNPETFKIINQKLYLFFNGHLNGGRLNTLPEWNKDEMNLLTLLPVQWSKLK